MVKIDTSEMKRMTRTKTSVFIRFLIKVCFLPITLEENDQRIGFKLISRRGLAYIVIYIIGLGLMAMLSLNLIVDEDTLSKMADENAVETYSIFFSNIFYISLIFPLLLAKGLNKTSVKIGWNEGLPFPKHGVKSIISYFCSTLGAVAAMVGFLLQFDVLHSYLNQICLIFSLSGKYLI